MKFCTATPTAAFVTVSRIILQLFSPASALLLLLLFLLLPLRLPALMVLIKQRQRSCSFGWRLIGEKFNHFVGSLKVASIRVGDPVRGDIGGKQQQKKIAP